MSEPSEAPADDDVAIRIDQALANLRKQHIWGDLSDDEYRAERRTLERQLRKIARPSRQPIEAVDLDQAAAFLGDLHAVWAHPGVTNEQRGELIREVFESIRVKGNELVSVEPKPEYGPLFAYAVVSGVRNGRGDWIRTNGLVHPMHARYRTAPHPDVQ